MEWYSSYQLRRICNFYPLSPAPDLLLRRSHPRISCSSPFSSSSKSPLFRTFHAAHFRSHSAFISPSSPTLQLRSSIFCLQLQTPLFPCNKHSRGSAQADDAIELPMTSFNLKRNRGSRISVRRKENRSRISALNGGDDGQAMILATTDAGGSPRETEKDPLLPEMPSSKLLTLPTILTLGRVVAVPALFLGFYSNEWWATSVVACIFVLAALTDWLDGFLARKMRSHSAFGAFLDPVADKLMVATALVLLCTKPLQVSWAAAFPWLIPLPAASIIGREITMSAVREWAASQGGDLQAAVAVNSLGKWKTASQMVALTVLLATRDCSQNNMASLLVGVGIGLLYISAGLALWSLAVYMNGIWGTLIK